MLTILVPQAPAPRECAYRFLVEQTHLPISFTQEAHQAANDESRLLVLGYKALAQVPIVRKFVYISEVYYSNLAWADLYQEKDDLEQVYLSLNNSEKLLCATESSFNDVVLKVNPSVYLVPDLPCVDLVMDRQEYLRSRRKPVVIVCGDSDWRSKVLAQEGIAGLKCLQSDMGGDSAVIFDTLKDVSAVVFQKMPSRIFLGQRLLDMRDLIASGIQLYKYGRVESSFMGIVAGLFNQAALKKVLEGGTLDRDTMVHLQFQEDRKRLVSAFFEEHFLN